MVRDLPLLVRYMIAVVLGLLATIAALALGDSTGTAYYWPLFAATILTAWVSGTGPGVLVTGISTAVIIRVYEHPSSVRQLLAPGMAIRLLGFGLTALMICGLTEQRRKAFRREAYARQIAEEALRARDLLLTTVAHDLKSPIGVILMRAQLLQRRLGHKVGADTATARDGLASIEATAQRVITIIDQQLDSAHATMHQAISLNRGPIDLVPLIRACVNEWQAVSDEHHIVFATAFPILVGHWDAARLERVIDNLLSNAVKYSPQGGAVSITLTRDRGPRGDEAVLTVQDEGMGIPAADLPKIFAPFHRAGNVRNAIAGNGVGLASVRALVEQHDGTISVTSTERRGTTFTIRLPIA